MSVLLMDSFVLTFLKERQTNIPPGHFRNAREFVDICVLDQHIELLMELARALTLAPEDESLSSEEWANRTEPLLTHLENTLALTPGEDLTKTCFEVLNLRSVSQLPLKRPIDQRYRRIASMLASEQSVKDLQRLFHLYRSDTNYFEVLSLLLHELILRGIQCSGIALFESHLALLQERNHPLAALPGQLLNVEIGVEEYLPRYSLSSTSWARPHREEAQPVVERPSEEIILLDQEELSPEKHAQLLEAVSLWQSTLNQQSEAFVFHSKEPLRRETLGPTLMASWPIQSFNPELIKLQALQPHRVFALLFGAAAQTGASKHSFMGPYGRLATWKTLAALTDSPANASIQEVSNALSRSLCLEIFANDKYFESSGRSLSILCINPTRSKLSFFIARDGTSSFY
jgi:hypothetical protein